MSNPYYDHTTFPTPNAPGSSAQLRAELDLIEAGFDKLPTLTGNANKVVVVNSGETALIATSTVTGLTLSSPALTGTPTAPTSAAGTNTTQVATTAFVNAERSNTATLTNKTFNLNNNTFVATSAQLAAAITDESGSGALLFANSPALTGTPTAPTAAGGTNTTQIATTAFVATNSTNYAPLASPALTGTPTAPTAAAGTSSTQLATTAFVAATAFSSVLPAQTGNAGKYVTTNGTTASWASVYASQQQDFASSGTWTKPTGATFVMVEAWGAGGGAASGARRASLNARAGGGGGGGGAYNYRIFRAAELPSSVAVTVGLGGSGGTAITTDNSNGLTGSNGGNTSFGTFLTGYGGGGGDIVTTTANGGHGGGTQSAGTSSIVGAPGTGSTAGAAFGGGSGSSTTNPGVSSGFGGGGGGSSLQSSSSPTIGGVSSWGGAGGSGGGAITTADANLYSPTTPATGYFGVGGQAGYAMLSLSNYIVADIAFGNSTFVAVGLQSHILTSSNGTSWTFVPGPFTVTFLGVLYDGTKWVAWTDTAVWTSTNLTSWTLATRAPLAANSFAYIAHNAGTYVAVGASGAIRTSTDLAAWTSQTSGASSQLNHVIYDGTRWIAVGSGDVCTSTDAVTWTRYAPVASFDRVASSGSVIVAVTSGATAAYRSTNAGATFTAASTPPASDWYRSLIYAGGQFVAAGSTNSTVSTSTDGNTWTTQTDGTTDNYRGIAYGLGLYVVGSNTNNSNAVISSPNGTAWTTRTATAFGPASTAGWSGSIACGGGGGGASLNGTASGAGGAGGTGYCRVYSW